MDLLAHAALPPLWLVRIAVALVWLYEGLWCKLLGGAPGQNDIVKAHPVFRRIAGLFMTTLAVVEVGLGVWVLTGWLPVWAALAQTLLLVVMNANGLAFARQHIHDPGGMLVKNFALIVLAWVAAAMGSAS